MKKTVKGDFGESPVRKEESFRQSLGLLRLSKPEENVGRNMGGKGHSDEFSEMRTYCWTMEERPTLL